MLIDDREAMVVSLARRGLPCTSPPLGLIQPSTVQVAVYHHNPK